MTDYVPVVDVSEHQGTIDFAVMKSLGVAGVIIRATHGLSRDARLDTNAAQSRGQFGEDAIGYYEFVNPKRGTAELCAEAFVAHVRSVHPLEHTFLMLDIENYANESPFQGTFFPADKYTAWLRAHIDHLHTIAPCPIVGYTASSFWSWGVGDRAIAAELDWIVPRYPIDKPTGYAKWPLPPDTSGWVDWAFSVQPKGPQPPMGATGWAGWQFSAGNNAQGAPYGCQSSDLDFNIIERSAWERWTRTAPIGGHPEVPVPPAQVPSIGDEMQLSYNGMILERSGFMLRRVVSGRLASLTTATATVDRATLRDIIVESQPAGPNPFDSADPALAGFVDADLAQLWNAGLTVPGGDTVSPKIAALDAKVEHLLGQLRGV